MNLKVISVVTVLALAALACGFNITLPQAPTPGPEQTDQISVPAPASGETRLTFSFGAGELTLEPGAQNLVDGSVTYRNPDLKPDVIASDGNVEIKEGTLHSIPSPESARSAWNFKLGSQPMDLRVNAGAYKGTYELGGLALTGLTIKDGAANTKLSFSQPNRAQMAILRYETGASSVKLSGLANANFDTLVFSSGAGDYTLDFSGTLKRDATITITSGLSNLMLVIPEGVKANVTVESGASNVHAGSGWSQNGNVYAQSGSGPVLTFIVKTGAGNLTLTH
jgi:uncharacterized protein DUF2154